MKVRYHVVNVSVGKSHDVKNKVFADSAATSNFQDLLELLTVPVLRQFYFFIFFLFFFFETKTLLVTWLCFLLFS